MSGMQNVKVSFGDPFEAVFRNKPIHFQWYLLKLLITY